MSEHRRSDAAIRPTGDIGHRPWGQVLVLLIVFVAGGATGAAVGIHAVHKRMEYFRENPDALTVAVMPRLERQLSLSDQQTEKVREIVSRRHPRILDIRSRCSEGMHAEFDEMVQEVEEVLRDGQVAQWHALSHSVRNRFLGRPSTSTAAAP